MEKRTVAFTEKARDFGLPAPRGVLLLGVQGCGKSLSAKAIGALWRLPLLRLDVGDFVAMPRIIPTTTEVPTMAEFLPSDTRSAFADGVGFVRGRGGLDTSVVTKMPQYVNEDIGYLLGLIASDGYLSKRHRIGF